METVVSDGPWCPKENRLMQRKPTVLVCLYALIATLSACTGFANNSSSGAATAAAGPSKYTRTASGQTVATNSVDACLPFAIPDAAALYGSTKKVFAHYFYPFPLSIDNRPPEQD